MTKKKDSKPFYFDKNQPGKPNIWLRDTNQIAQHCQLNFRQTSIGNAPIIDLVCQNPQEIRVSVAQYMQEGCNREPITNSTFVTPSRNYEFTTTTTEPPNNMQFFASLNEKVLSCANIRHFTRRRRFINYLFGGLLSLTVNAVVGSTLSKNSLHLPECPNGTINFAASCIDQYYQKCPQGMVNVHFFQRLN